VAVTEVNHVASSCRRDSDSNYSRGELLQVAVAVVTLAVSSYRPGSDSSYSHSELQ
jgi:hypothetical protein